MEGNKYQELAMRTNDGKSSDRISNALIKSEKTQIDLGGCIMACMGLSGEVGEFNDLMKKIIFHESKFDEDHLKKELGDICWYVAMMCESFGWKLEDIMCINVDKLKKRYPEGFDVYKANNRGDSDV